jgi:acyl-CoA synthetase (AMP-forming)/AMP-acid ligase II
VDEIQEAAAFVAASLAAAGVGPGNRVLVVEDSQRSFLSGLFGALWIGAIAVPVPSISSPRSAARCSAVYHACSPTAIVSHSVEQFAQLQPRCAQVVVGAAQAGHIVRPAPYARVPSDVAVLQFTSGSVATPRGVGVSHHNIIAACTQAAIAYEETIDDVCVNWVPLHHDMGLITSVFRPLLAGYRAVLLPPRAFAASPRLWLEVISSQQGSITSAPDFGYELCTRKTTDLSGLSLTSLRIARNAGEVVQASTLSRFSSKFAAAGFDPHAFCPSYGLAEATLTVTTVTRRSRAVGGVRRPSEASSHHGAISCGAPMPDTVVSIRDPHSGETLPTGAVGEIHVRGPQVAEGYWSSSLDRVEQRQSEWLATGDIGVLDHDGLRVLGRLDDSFTLRGEQWFAEDIEAEARACPSVCGRVLAAVFDQGYVLMQESADPVGAAADLTKALRVHLGRAGFPQPISVVIVRRTDLLMTTSGKPRRRATAAAYLKGVIIPWYDDSPTASKNTYPQ